MSFFTGSSCFTILGGIFTIINPPTREAGQCSSRNSDGLMIVQDNEVVLHKELISGNRYRIHSASHGERFVAVRTFEGPHAKQAWAVDMALSRKVFHPNVLKIVGVSDESSKNHFVVFHGITSEQRMQSLIAKALRTDLNTSVQLSMNAVKGIAAGLCHLKSQNIPMHAGRLNFDIFIGYENEPILSFHPSAIADGDGSVSQNFDTETGDHGIEALNRLCQQLFSQANSILYDDSPERKFDAYDNSLPTVTLEDGEGTSESQTTSNPSGSTEKSKSGPTPRREVWWFDLGATNQCLESIKRCFEDRLDRFLISSSKSLLRRIRSPKGNNIRRNLHQCPGYLREEITLTSDVSRSAIVSHAFPSQSELCSICGQLVQYPYSDPYIIDEEIELRDHSRNQASQPSLVALLSSPPSHRSVGSLPTSPLIHGLNTSLTEPSHGQQIPETLIQPNLARLDSPAPSSVSSWGTVSTPSPNYTLLGLRGFHEGSEGASAATSPRLRGRRINREQLSQYPSPTPSLDSWHGSTASLSPAQTQDESSSLNGYHSGDETEIKLPNYIRDSTDGHLRTTQLMTRGRNQPLPAVSPSLLFGEPIIAEEDNRSNPRTMGTLGNALGLDLRIGPIPIKAPIPVASHRSFLRSFSDGA